MKQARRALGLQPAPVPVRSLSARALNAVGWSYFAGFIFLVSQVGYTAITARLVSPLAYGGYALALTMVGTGLPSGHGRHWRFGHASSRTH